MTLYLFHARGENSLSHIGYKAIKAIFIQVEKSEKIFRESILLIRKLFALIELPALAGLC